MNAKQSIKQQERIIKSGEMMQGVCIQWFIDKYGFSNDGKVNGFELYAAILRKTFGYRQKFNYISQSFFGMSPNKLKRHRDYLSELGILEWHITKNMTMYRILEPACEIIHFRFSTNKDDSTGSDIQKYNLSESMIKKINSFKVEEELITMINIMKQMNQKISKNEESNMYAFFNKTEPVEEDNSINDML